MPAAIDTLKFAKHLRAAGMTVPQAEAFAEAVAEGIGEELATKVDVAAVRADLAAMEGAKLFAKQSLNANHANPGDRLVARLDAMETRILRRLDAMETRLLRWMGAGFVATIAILATQILVER